MVRTAAPARSFPYRLSKVISKTTLQDWLLGLAPGALTRLRDRIRASPIGHRLARGTFWSLAAGGVSRLLALVASIILARLLGKEGFGQLGILQSTLEMFGTFAAFGLGLTSTKYVAECRASDPDKAGRILGMTSMIAWVTGGACALFLMGFAPWLAAHTLAAPQLAPLLQISSLSLLFGAINGAQTGGLAGFEAFKSLAQINLVSGLLTVLFRVGGTMWMGLEGAVWGMVLAQMAGCLMNALMLRRMAVRSSVVVRYTHCLKDLPVIWKFSLPAVLMSFLIMPTSWLCNALLVNRPGGYGEMAVLNAANQWYFALLFIPSLMGEAALPILFDRMNHRDHRSAHKIFFATLQLNAVVILPLLLLGLLSKPVMGLYGNDFAGGWLTLLIVLITAALQAVQMPAGYMLVASGRMWLAFLMALGWSLSYVVATVGLVQWGSVGVASARLMALGIHCLWTFAFAFQALKNNREPETAGSPAGEPGGIKLLAALQK